MGKMGELGEKSNSFQDQVISLSSEIFDLVFALDIETNLSYKNLKLINASEIENLLLDHLNEDSIVLFKASRSVRMERIVKLFI
jgi:UDP-N-acetylmuramyl pentapeptide synthase